MACYRLTIDREQTDMKQIFRLTTWALLLALTSNQAAACTLWAVAGADASGGTLISKNRDWKPDHTQKLKLVRPKKGFDYFGLYAEGNDEPRLRSIFRKKRWRISRESAV